MPFVTAPEHVVDAVATLETASERVACAIERGADPVERPQ